MKKFQVWANEINADWSGYKAIAEDEAVVVFLNSEELGRIDYNGGRYTVSGSNEDVVDQLTYMVER